MQCFQHSVSKEKDFKTELQARWFGLVWEFCCRLMVENESWANLAARRVGGTSFSAEWLSENASVHDRQVPTGGSVCCSTHAVVAEGHGDCSARRKSCFRNGPSDRAQRKPHQRVRFQLVAPDSKNFVTLSAAKNKCGPLCDSFDRRCRAAVRCLAPIGSLRGLDQTGLTHACPAWKTSERSLQDLGHLGHESQYERCTRAKSAGSGDGTGKRILDLDQLVPPSHGFEKRVLFGVDRDMLDRFMEEFHASKLITHIPAGCVLHPAALKLLQGARQAGECEPIDDLLIFADGAYRDVSKRCAWAFSAFSVRPDAYVWLGYMAGIVPENACQNHPSAFRAELFAQLMGMRENHNCI